MPKLEPNKTQQCAGFQLGVPVASRMLVTPIQLMPAHKMEEVVAPHPGVWKALWDTGAQSSTISTKLATQLGLPVIGSRKMKGAGGEYPAREYLAGLLLPNSVVIHEISLYEFVGSDHFDMLIGMDIITLGDFFVSTHAGMMHFSFQIPSMGGIVLQNIQKAVCSDGRVMTNYPTITRREPKLGRNEPCACGSGKKFKNCCCRDK